MMLVLNAIVGSILGVIASKFLFVGQWYSLIIWTIVGLVLSYFAKSKKEMLWQGAVFGFFLFFIFMVAGYAGKFSLISRIPFFVLIGLLGIVFGLIVYLAGFSLKKFLKK